jgi:L-ascorbate metabolism protein UlaG (beta-lactamase superfamily)
MRWIILAALMPVLMFGTACSYNSGPVSDHFDGGSFYNKEPDNTFTDHIKWLWEMEEVEWPLWVNDPQQPLPPERVGDGELFITYVNQSTVLLQVEGVNILTDPFWSRRAGPFSWAGSKRVRKPGIALEDLPPIDLILISHDHYDHLDLPTMRALWERHRPLVLTGLGVKERLDFIDPEKVIQLDWWDMREALPGVLVTFVPARHKSGRGLFDGNRTLWGGYVVEVGGERILFFGDTAYGDFLNGISEKFAGFTLAILPVGSYEKRWFMKSEHMNPDDAVKVHTGLHVEKSVGIHFATLLEHPEQAIDAHEKDLVKALMEHRVDSADFIIPAFGEGIKFK